MSAPPLHTSLLRLYWNCRFETITGPRNASTGPSFMPSNLNPSVFEARAAAQPSTARRLASVKTLGNLSATFAMLALLISSSSTAPPLGSPPQPFRSPSIFLETRVKTPPG